MITEGGWPQTLNQLLGWWGPLTHRQLLAFLEWRILALDYPDRSDYYRMMQASTTARANSSTPASIQPMQFRLRFNNKEEPITREERDRRAKEVMESRIASRGGLSRYTIMDAQGNVIKQAEQSPLTRPHPLARLPNDEERRVFQERQRQRQGQGNNIQMDSPLYSKPIRRTPRSAADSQRRSDEKKE